MRIPLHVYLGLPCFMAGLFLLSPAIVVMIDRLLGPVTAWLLGLKPSLLRHQLSGGLWRSAGTASALMVGLAVLILIRVHGSNMINTWQLPDKFPDLLIASAGSYTEQEVRALDELEEIADGQIFPVAFPRAELLQRMFGLGNLVQSPNATLMFGMDVEMVFGDANSKGEPLVELEYIEGNRDESIRLMQSGRFLLVSEEFRTLEGLGIGDKLTIDTPVHGPVDYTIAGVVRSPGIDLIVRVFQLDKEFNQWTAAAAATDLKNLKNDFAITRYSVMGANLIEGDRLELENAARKKLRERGLEAMGSVWIKRGVSLGLRVILELCASVALMSILVASIGVMNTIMSSLRSRRWHLGVLRAIGMTRGALLRLVVAEAVLIAIAACVLGLGGGLLLSYSADGMAGHVVGIRPDFQLHAGPFVLGAGVTIAVAVTAGLWPAIRTAYTSPLRLLQAGRAAG
jgi:putative ABC transport system permease protein